MSDRAKNLLTLLLVAFLLGLVGLISVVRSPVLGLDLRGGLEVVLQAVPNQPGQQVTQDDLDKSVSVITSRINSLGVNEPTITKEAGNRIDVELAGVHDPNQAATIIGSTALLVMVPTDTSLVPGISTSELTQAPLPQGSLWTLLQRVKTKPPKSFRPAGDLYAIFKPQWYALSSKGHRRFAGPDKRVVPPYGTRAALIKHLPHGRVPDGVVLLSVPSGYAAIECAGTAQNGCPGQRTPGTAWYLMKAPEPALALLGKELQNVRRDTDTQTGSPIVTFGFTSRGASQFHDITRRLAEDGRLAANAANAPASTDQNYFKTFAIVLDGKLEATPYIDFTKYGDGISGDNGAEISNLSLSEAKRISIVLQSGSLPVTLNPIEQTQVSATLGKQALSQGLLAGLLGLIAVMIYLIIFYRFLGLIADLALAIYAAFFYGLIVLIPITMTLPGIAGMILTIGVAADANVVIFERIKEEVRLGRTVRTAISSGYSKGFRTIIDANVVTLITAGVLFIAGEGSVKGFAFTLAVGVLVSMFTAVFATRAMLGVLGGFRWFNNASFMGASGQKVRWHVDIIGRRYLWFILSGVILLSGAVSLVAQGLNLGIDFKGGTRISTTFNQAATQPQVQHALLAIDNRLSDAIVQGRGSSSSADHYTRFDISFKNFKGTQQANELSRLHNLLPDRFGGLKNGAWDQRSVSASFGRTILVGAIYAVVFSLLLIIVYLTFRFEFKYAVPAIVALFHDLLVTVGVYSLTGRQVSSATVAAVLTVLGYSLYDTIIVFDRMRENVPLLRRNTYAQIVNVSIWETLTRSINTSLITLVPIASLLLFGGSTLKDFAFALLVGITSGAYSSIFVAAPILSMWKEAEPEYRKRRSTAIAPVSKATLDLSGDGAATAAGSDKAVAVPAGAPQGPDADEQAAMAAARKRRQERRRGRPHGRAR